MNSSKKANVRPIGVDLFAGAGGLSLGFEQAGFDVVAAVEIDAVHAVVHKYNFPECAVIPRSVTEISGAAIRKAAQIGEKNVDVVFGGAPCQGFSLIGQRAIDDPRNSLVREFVRLVKELDASYFVFENVKGLTVGKHKKFLAELIETFELAGYSVRREWRVLNAYSYGVPQDRERLFLLGAKRGLKIPEYPAAISSEAGMLTADKGLLPQGPSCHDALGDLPDAEEFSTLLTADEVKTTRWKTPSEYASLMRCLDSKAWGFGYQRAWQPGLLTASMRTDHTDISRGRFAATTPGTVEPISRFFKLSEAGVANTLRAGTDAARGAFTSPRPIHYKYNRCVTVREMARLHGFPDWFRFNETKWHGARQIGNSVPPPLGRAVAAQVIIAMGIKPSRPQRTVALGEPKLLKMGMVEAAGFWGVPSPASKRDKKSGVRKRSQKEIEQLRLGLI
jgi:DNA (cytosine-5)-methyltransferase 1